MTLSDDAKNDLATHGHHAAIARLQHSADQQAAFDAYEELMLHAYWQRKDIAAVIAIARAALPAMLKAADNPATADPDASTKILRRAKATAYNLASFCWPGWDEPGILLGQAERLAGVQAAAEHLRLARRLNLDHLRMSRALWIVAAHHLTSSEFARAQAMFEESAALAHAAAQEPDELLAKGFSLLSIILASPQDPPETRRRLDEIKHRLAQLKEGDDFVAQLTTAEKVCRRQT